MAKKQQSTDKPVDAFAVKGTTAHSIKEARKRRQEMLNRELGTNKK